MNGPLTCRNFDHYMHAKNELHPSLLRDIVKIYTNLYIVKILQTCDFEHFENA